jgi:hypothetical protein
MVRAYIRALTAKTAIRQHITTAVIKVVLQNENVIDAESNADDELR